MTGGLLTRKALVLAKIESVYDTDSVPTNLLDAILVSNPDFTADVTVLERDFVREDLSPLGHAMGRKLAGLSFGVELRSNGSTNSGSTADAAVIGRLLRACGYAETGITGAGCVGAAIAASGNVTSSMVFDSAAGASTYLEHSNLTVTVVKAGASATAVVRVSGGDGTPDPDILYNENFTISTNSAAGTVAVDVTDPQVPFYTMAGTWVIGEQITWSIGGHSGVTTVTGVTPTIAGDDVEADMTAIHADITAANVTGVVTITFTNDMLGTVMTTASTALDLGNSGSTTQMTWTGSLVLGESWAIIVTPVGIKYTPVSESFESITLYAYFDGTFHKLTGCFGTFTLNGEAGQYGTLEFTFTGTFYSLTDATLPTGSVFETTLPQQIELSRLQIDGFSAIVNAFTFDQGNTIAVRPDVNSSDGYQGVRITARNPQGGIDPEAELVATEDFWTKLSAATQMDFQMKFGSSAGNIVWVTAPSVQYTGLTYGDRDGFRVYDAGLKFGRVSGNDEISFFFG